jgi:hypothetical protein
LRPPLLPVSNELTNQVSLLIDATCAPADIRHPTDLSILNEARDATDKLVVTLQSGLRDAFGFKPPRCCVSPGSSAEQLRQSLLR